MKRKNNKSKKIKKQRTLLNYPDKELNHQHSSSNDLKDNFVLPSQNTDNKTQTSTVSGQNSSHNSPILKGLELSAIKETVSLSISPKIF